MRTDDGALGAERYRCGVSTQVPVTLGNVTSTQRPMFMFGSGSAMAWSALAVLGMRLYGQAKAKSLEGKTLSVPAQGVATLLDGGIWLNLSVAGRVAGTTIRGGAQTLELEIPYRLIRTWGADQRGVYLDLLKRGAMWLHPQDRGDFQQWLAHLAYGKTWVRPEPEEAKAEVPIVGWCQQDRRFTFGMPAGWGQPPPEAWAISARNFLPSTQVACIGMNAGQWEPQMVVVDIGLAQTDSSQDLVEALAADIAEASSITPKGGRQLLSLNGDPMVLTRGTSLTTTREWVDRGYGSVVHKGSQFLLWYNIVDASVGDGSYERWLPDLHSMIATWHWYA